MSIMRAVCLNRWEFLPKGILLRGGLIVLKGGTSSEGVWQLVN